MPRTTARFELLEKPAALVAEASRKTFENLVHCQLQILGEDPSREGLLQTPARVAKSMAFLTSGYKENPADTVNGAIFDTKSDEMVLVKGIEFYSLCEHHMLPFFGQCHIAYLPAGKIIGLSKLARLVEVFARRLQVQERMTQEIAESLSDLLPNHGVAIVSKAEHLCMKMRGIQKQNSQTITSFFTGKFREEPARRAEFLSMLQQI